MIILGYFLCVICSNKALYEFGSNIKFKKGIFQNKLKDEDLRTRAKITTLYSFMYIYSRFIFHQLEKCQFFLYTFSKQILLHFSHHTKKPMQNFLIERKPTHAREWLSGERTAHLVSFKFALLFLRQHFDTPPEFLAAFKLSFTRLQFLLVRKIVARISEWRSFEITVDEHHRDRCERSRSGGRSSTGRRTEKSVRKARRRPRPVASPLVGADLILCVCTY